LRSSASVTRAASSARVWPGATRIESVAAAELRSAFFLRSGVGSVVDRMVTAGCRQAHSASERPCSGSAVTPSTRRAPRRTVSAVSGSVPAAARQASGTSTRPRARRPSSSTSRASSLTSAVETSGATLPQMPECTSDSRASQTTSSSSSPRKETVRPGTSVEGFSQSVSTMTSASKASGWASM